MRRRHLCVASLGCLLVLGAGFAIGGGCSDGGDDRRHLVADPKGIDFGRLLYGDTEIRTFVLRNQGDGDVFVVGALPNCVCFQIRPFTRLIGPGEERRIEVSLVSRLLGKPDRLRGKKVDIVSNDPVAPRIEVPVSGEVVLALAVQPPQIDFGVFGREAIPEPQTVAVRPGRGFEGEIVSWRLVPDAGFQVEQRDVPGGVDFVIVPVVREGMAVGPRRASLKIRTRVQGEGFPPRVVDATVEIVAELAGGD